MYHNYLIDNDALMESVITCNTWSTIVNMF